MSGKVKNKGSSNYDTHNNIMALEGDLDEQMKYMINKVMEVVKNRSQDDVMLVLQYFDYDIDTTVDAFLEDGAADILKKWNHTNSLKQPTNKNKKKKKNKKKSSMQDNVAAPVSETVAEEGTTKPLSNGVSSPAPLELPPSSHTQESSLSSTEQKDGASSVQTSLERVVMKDEESLQQRLNERDTDNRLTEQTPLELDTASSTTTTTTVGNNVKSVTPDSVTEGLSISPSDNSRPLNRNRHRSSGSQSRTRPLEGSGTDSAAAAALPQAAAAAVPAATTAFSQPPGKKILEKSLKDLSRQTVALHRVSNLLEEEVDTSFKRIKTAIAEAQRLLEDRSQDLEREMERVKKESRQLLNQRKELAAELKQRTERASTMGEAELNELRADIKHFVVERKYDEELGKTCRFMWDKDRITQEIKAFGEVHHVKNCYSQRRQSVSSVASSSNMTSSMTEQAESSPINQTELDQEIVETHHENVTQADTRPQQNVPIHSRMFFSRRNFNNSDMNRQSFNRGAYPPRGRGGESRGGRGNSRGGRRDDGGYRGMHDTSYYQKPQYSSQKADDHGSSGGNAGFESSNVGWPPRDQRGPRRGGGRQGTRFQARLQAHHSPRHNYASNDRISSTSEAHLNGSESPDLLNGFVDHLEKKKPVV